MWAVLPKSGWLHTVSPPPSLPRSRLCFQATWENEARVLAYWCDRLNEWVSTGWQPVALDMRLNMNAAGNGPRISLLCCSPKPCLATAALLQ